jgi:hypothetical protein
MNSQKVATSIQNPITMGNGYHQISLDSTFADWARASLDNGGTVINSTFVPCQAGAHLKTAAHTKHSPRFTAVVTVFMSWKATLQILSLKIHGSICGSIGTNRTIRPRSQMLVSIAPYDYRTLTHDGPACCFPTSTMVRIIHLPPMVGLPPMVA